MAEGGPTLYANARALSDRYTVYAFISIFASFIMMIVSVAVNLGSVTGGELNFGVVKLVVGSDWVIRAILFLTSLLGVLVAVTFTAYAMIQDRIGGYALLRSLPPDQQADFNEMIANQVVGPLRLVGYAARLFFVVATLLVLLHIGVFIASFWILE